MKIVDLHADIGMHVLTQHRNGFQNVLRDSHLSKLQQGEIVGVGMACFFEGHETMKDMIDMVTTLRSEINENPDTVHLVESAVFHDSKLNAIMTVEGMCPVISDPEAQIDWLYEKGVRIGSLSWNDENALSTGVKGDPARGLTELGKRTITRMNEKHMIVDVSHASEKSFWDILSHSSQPIIATHSNALTLCNVERNLSDQQIKAIADQGGLIGLVAAKHFISTDTENQTANTLALHARHIADISSVDVVAMGFDFMDYLEAPFGNDSMAGDLENASQAQNLISALLNNGFSPDEVEKIANGNVLEFLRKNL